MEIADQERVLNAIEMQGNPAYITPSGPILDVMTNFAQEGKIREISEAYGEFKKSFPLNAVTFVRRQIPAKLWHHWCRRGQSVPHQWLTKNDDWAEQIVDAVPYPDVFESVVAAFDKEMSELREKVAAKS